MRLNYDYEDRKDDYGKCGYEHKEYEKKDRKEYDCHDREKCCEDHKYAKCYPKNPCPYPILFECSQGTGAQIRSTATNNGGFRPISLGCVTIDTTCLKMPVVKFDFCSKIEYRVFSTTPEPVSLQFQLFKQCDDGQEIACGNWYWEALLAPVAATTPSPRITTSFCFTHCECNSCPGCCTYIVKLVDARNVETDDILNVCDTALSVFAKSSC